MIYFSDFAKALYGSCGKGATQSEFVLVLTNKIMARPDVKNIDGDFKNPMKNMTPSYLRKFFRGERKTLPKKATNKIIGNLNKLRFEQYLRSEFTDDTRRIIAESLERLGVAHVSENNVCEKCGDIFEAILRFGKYEEVPVTDIDSVSQEL